MYPRQLDAGIVGAQRTLSGSHEERGSRGFDNPGDNNIPSPLSILLSTKSEVCSLSIRADSRHHIFMPNYAPSCYDQFCHD